MKGQPGNDLKAEPSRKGKELEQKPQHRNGLVVFDAKDNGLKIRNKRCSGITEG